jgi:hypothetical protein
MYGLIYVAVAMLFIVAFAQVEKNKVTKAAAKRSYKGTAL